ncbi:MAG: hypothetical protein ACR2H3_00010 [Acidimicrobiales bacterium]
MPSDNAALAPNWRTVLAVDGALGMAVAIIGAILGVVAMPIVGSLFVVAGLAYVGLVVRRAGRWRDLRREAGLG